MSAKSWADLLLDHLVRNQHWLNWKRKKCVKKGLVSKKEMKLAVTNFSSQSLVVVLYRFGFSFAAPPPSSVCYRRFIKICFNSRDLSFFTGWHVIGHREWIWHYRDNKRIKLTKTEKIVDCAKEIKLSKEVNMVEAKNGLIYMCVWEIKWMCVRERVKKNRFVGLDFLAEFNKKRWIGFHLKSDPFGFFIVIILAMIKKYS